MLVGLTDNGHEVALFSELLVSLGVDVGEDEDAVVLTAAIVTPLGNQPDAVIYKGLLGHIAVTLSVVYINTHLASIV